MIAAIQYLRALSAIFVVWHHAREQLPGLVEMFPHTLGGFGVRALFAISGFVVVLSTAPRNESAREFLLRRFLRIVPLYWVTTLAVSAIAWGIPHVLKSTVATPGTLLQSLLFIPHRSLGHPEYIWPILYPGWTLHYVAFFYLLFAVCMTVSHDKRSWLAAGVLAGLITFGQLVHFDDPVLATYTHRLWWTFLLGVVLGQMSLDGHLPKLTLPTAWAHARALRGLRLLGDASYSVYLTHLFALVGLREVWKHWRRPVPAGYADALVFMLAGVVLALALGLWVYLRIEVPMLAWLKRRMVAWGWLPARKERPGGLAMVPSPASAGEG